MTENERFGLVFPKLGLKIRARDLPNAHIRSPTRTVFCTIYTTAKIMCIRSIHGTTVFAHPEKRILGTNHGTYQNAFETSGAPLVHSNSTSTYSNVIERVQ
jgi:hypothetical protein